MDDRERPFDDVVEAQVVDVDGGVGDLEVERSALGELALEERLQVVRVDRAMRLVGEALRAPLILDTEGSAETSAKPKPRKRAG